MKAALLLLITCFVAFSAFAYDSLERDYVGSTDAGESCNVRLRDSQGNASFHYYKDGASQACAFTYDILSMTKKLDSGWNYASVKDTSGFKSCKMIVYLNSAGEVERLRMGLKSIFNPFHTYEDCNIELDTL